MQVRQRPASAGARVLERVLHEVEQQEHKHDETQVGVTKDLVHLPVAGGLALPAAVAGRSRAS
jgi:hypothetical protein